MRLSGEDSKAFARSIFMPTADEIKEKRKHIDRINKVFGEEDEMQKPFDEIKEEILDYVCNKEENTEKAQGMLNALKIVEKHMESKGV